MADDSEREVGMTRSEARNWAERALICWVEGSVGGYVGPKQGNGECGLHDGTFEDKLSQRLSALVDRVIETCGMLPHARVALRRYVASRQGKNFFWEYTWIDAKGRSVRTTALMVYQSKRVMAKLIGELQAKPHIVRVQNMVEDAA